LTGKKKITTMYYFNQGKLQQKIAVLAYYPSGKIARLITTKGR